MLQVIFRFHAELNDFLPAQRRGMACTQPLDRRASVKDMIEAQGVPHAEVELLVVNGRSVGFDYIVQGGDEVQVYPRFDALDLPDKVRLRPPLPERPRFVLDIHLGRLAAYLRMIGFDALYGDTNNHAEFLDAALARIAHDQGRVLLTHDVGLLKRSLVIYGYWVRSMSPRDHLAEVMRRFDLFDKVELFRRCMSCNGLLQPVEKAAVLHLLPAETARHYDEFRRCTSCGKIYWRGVHVKRMTALVEEIMKQRHGPTDPP
ncbi:MAG: Mut7-C RNAse domain-containing protein [Anaerolineae bacterium]